MKKRFRTAADRSAAETTLLISSTEPNTANAVDDTYFSSIFTSLFCSLFTSDGSDLGLFSVLSTEGNKGTVSLLVSIRHYNIIHRIGCIWFC